MRSAWLKWARGVEHGKYLARATREFTATSDRYKYVRFDNADDHSDPLVRMHWTLRTSSTYPERWSVLLADAIGNFRAALDHCFWYAAVEFSGSPARPERVMFPICSTGKDFHKRASDLEQLVDPAVWKVVAAVQPLRGGSLAHTDPLEILRWLSNVDKHRALHVVGSTFVDLGAALIGSVTPLEVVERWVREGSARDGDVVARLKIRRPLSNQEIDVVPTFAHLPTIQISENPVEFRGLGSAINVISERVTQVLYAMMSELGLALPDLEQLETGAENDSILPDAGGEVLVWSTPEGSRELHRLWAPRADGGNAEGI